MAADAITTDTTKHAAIPIALRIAALLGRCAQNKKRGEKTPTIQRNIKGSRSENLT
jgi:hypothetical protein